MRELKRIFEEKRRFAFEWAKKVSKETAEIKAGIATEHFGSLLRHAEVSLKIGIGHIEAIIGHFI